MMFRSLLQQIKSFIFIFFNDPLTGSEQCHDTTRQDKKYRAPTCIHDRRDGIIHRKASKIREIENTIRCKSIQSSVKYAICQGPSFNRWSDKDQQTQRHEKINEDPIPQIDTQRHVLDGLEEFLVHEVIYMYPYGIENNEYDCGDAKPKKWIHTLYCHLKKNCDS